MNFLKYVIFDLDGTLADISLRRKKAMNDDGKINWASFFDPRNIELDSPIKDVVDLYHMMCNDPNIKVVMFSGRSDSTMAATIDWFSEHNILLPDIFKMRKEGDYTQDQELKKEWLVELLNEEQIKLDDIFFVVDDRNKVVEMWRNQGLTCFQCENGDF